MTVTSESQRGHRHTIRLAAFAVGALPAAGRTADAGHSQFIDRSRRYARALTRDLIADWQAWMVGERIAACLLAALLVAAGPIGLIVTTVGASI